MVPHSQYNLALRLAGLLFKTLLFLAPIAILLFFLLPFLQLGWDLRLWLNHLIEWMLGMGAIACISLLIGSIWDAL